MGVTLGSSAASVASAVPASFNGVGGGVGAAALGEALCLSVLVDVHISGLMPAVMEVGCTGGAELGAANSCAVFPAISSDFGRGAGAIRCGIDIGDFSATGSAAGAVCHGCSQPIKMPAPSRAVANRLKYKYMGCLVEVMGVCAVSSVGVAPSWRS